MDIDKWVDVFKYSPAIIALLSVIYLMYLLLRKKDEIIEKIIEKSKADVERQAKLIALLEILVGRNSK